LAHIAYKEGDFVLAY